MILTGREIKKRLGSDIGIKPFSDDQLNPNSYNLRLHGELMTYKTDVLDAKIKNETETFVIPEDGFVLQPGELYLARTEEYTETHNLVPMILGRSSVGRLGVTVHITSGFGDIGFAGYWTLQLTCVKSVRIYPGMKICQIFYHTPYGEYDEYTSTKYQGNKGIVESKIYEEIKK